MRSTRSRSPESGPMRQGPTGRRRMSKPDGIMLFRELFGERRIVDCGLELSQIARSQFGFLGARRVECAPAPRQLEIGKANASAATGSAAAQRVVFEQTQSFEQTGREGFVLVAQNVEHHADL